MSLQYSREELLSLYKISVDEYRFEVKLNWDRTRYYIVFNSALTSVPTGLLNMQDPRIVRLFVAAVYMIGFTSCVVGRAAILNGHRYYRRTIVNKTLLEELLGLTSRLPEYPIAQWLSIGTTLGQSEHLQVLHDTDRWLNRKLRRMSITSLTTFFLILLAIVDCVGAGAATWFYFDVGHGSPKNSIRLVPVTALVPSPLSP